MPTLCSDIINEAFIDLGVNQAGDTVTGSLQSNAFLVLQQMIRSWSSERYMNRPSKFTFQPIAGTASYTVGDGGAFDTGSGSVSPLLVGPAFMSRSGAYRSGGRVMPMIEFDEKVKDGIATSSVLVQYVGADQGLGLATPNNTPLPTVKLWPTPAAAPGLLDLDLLMPLTLLSFAAVSDSLAGFPPGWERALHWNLAKELYPQYSRNANPEVLFANAQESKAILAEIGRIALGEAAPAQQQGG